MKKFPRISMAAIKRVLFILASLGVMAASSAVIAQEVVRVGFSGPLSGGGALYGKNNLNGIEMAIKELNDDNFQIGGKRVKFEVVALDDKYAPAESAINARRLVLQDKVSAVFIPHTGGIYALQSFNEAEKFLIMAYSSVPRVTEVGNKLTVRLPPPFSIYVDPFSQFQMQKYGKKVGLLPGDHEYAKAWTEIFVAGWKRAGGTVTASNPMSYNKASDFYSGVSRVLATQPDVLFVGGPSEPTALVVKQARELGFKGGFIMMDQSKIDEMAKVLGGLGALEGALSVLPVALDQREGAMTFSSAYRKMFGADREPTQESSYNYVFMHVLANAMRLAGTTTDAVAIRAKMPDALKQLPASKNSGSFTGIDAAGGALVAPLLGLVEGGKVRALNL